MFIGVVTLTPFLFTYLFTLQEIKELNSDKNKFLEVLREKENKLEMRKVEYQKLTSEDVVVSKAKDKFDLVRIEYLDKIQINNNKISNLKKYIAKNNKAENTRKNIEI